MNQAVAEAEPLAAIHNELVTVPEITLPGGLFVPSFLVGKYNFSKSDEGTAIITADRKSWTRINYDESIQATKQAGFEPMLESRRLSIAYQASLVDENWTGGKVGQGEMVRGLHLWTVNGPQDGHYESDQPTERRWLVLPNGERIFDISGHIYAWVFDDIQGDEKGLIAKPFAEDSPTVTTPTYPSMTHGMGYTDVVNEDWSGSALLRGGFWGSDSYAGVFVVYRDDPSYRGDAVGFRGTKSL